MHLTCVIASASGEQESSEDDDEFNEADDMKDDTQDLTGTDACVDGKVFDLGVIIIGKMVIDCGHLLL